MNSCVLLAAGLSQRFGSPKALAVVNDQPVIQRIQNTLLAANVDEIIVVLGAQAQDVQRTLLKHKRIKTVYNKDYIFGQTSSFQAGWRVCSAKTEAVFLYPVDYPWIKSETIASLSAARLETPEKILIPSFLQRKGHPPLFPTRFRDEFLNLSAQSGCHLVAQRHPDAVRLLPVTDEGVVASFNTVEELSMAQERFQDSPGA